MDSLRLWLNWSTPFASSSSLRIFILLRSMLETSCLIITRSFSNFSRFYLMEGSLSSMNAKISLRVYMGELWAGLLRLNPLAPSTIGYISDWFALRLSSITLTLSISLVILSYPSLLLLLSLLKVVLLSISSFLSLIIIFNRSCSSSRSLNSFWSYLSYISASWFDPPMEVLAFLSYRSLPRLSNSRSPQSLVRWARFFCN